MSKKTELDELRAALHAVLTPHLPVTVPYSVLEAAIIAATADWTATRKDFPHRDRHPLEEARWGHQIIVTLPFVPETNDERTDRKARRAADSWASRAHFYGWNPQDPEYDHDNIIGPPPERISIRGLLRQGLWWRTRTTRNLDDRTTEAIRLADMTHTHRLGLLNFLRQRAPGYKLREDWHYASIPGPNGDMASLDFEQECDRQWETPAAEWIEDQPLVQALVYWTTPYAESPLTWRPMNEAPRDGTEIMARWENPEIDDPLVRVYWSKSTWGWWAVGGTDELVDPLLEWRELYDHEKPPPAPLRDHEDDLDCADCPHSGYIDKPCYGLGEQGEQ